MERRAARRYDLSLPIVIRLPQARESSQKGQTRDISTRGVYFTLDRNIDAGSELDITLTLPSEITRGTEVLVRAQGRVIRVDPHDPTDTRVGVAAVIERYDIIRGGEQPIT
jgi:PilZ domain